MSKNKWVFIDYPNFLNQFLITPKSQQCLKTHRLRNKRLIFKQNRKLHCNESFFVLTKRIENRARYFSERSSYHNQTIFLFRRFLFIRSELTILFSDKTTMAGSPKSSP